MQSLVNLIPFIVICAIALLITFVLFKYLNSTAEGEGKALNGTVKYGGALAGFVVVSGVLSTIYTFSTKKQPIDQRQTETDIAGLWKVKYTQADRASTDIQQVPNWAEACIQQKPGQSTFSVAGKISTDSVLEEDLSFRSTKSLIKNQKIEVSFLFDNGEITDGTLVDATATISSNRPEQIIFHISDEDEPDDIYFLEFQKLSGKCNF